MKVAFARKIAFDWVIKHASKESDFIGAYFSGSTINMPDVAELPESSDIDVVIVTSKSEPPLKLGKFIYNGVLIEITNLSWKHFSSANDVLRSYHLAGSFRVDSIIADPTGKLKRLQEYVSRQFADEKWVRQRCENARLRIENGIKTINTSAPFHEQVLAWLFPSGVTTHVLLVAALKNPTVRLRYLEARKVLIDYGHYPLYSDLLNLLGCSQLSSDHVNHHLSELARTFDITVSVAKTPFFFSSDITKAARPIAIDGSRELIENGNHHEAVFWIVATFARCHTILEADASTELQRSLTPAFNNLLSDIGITSSADLIHRAEKVIKFLPKLWETAEEIILDNKDVVAG